MSAPDTKRYGKKMPLIVDNGERICFKLPMPDQLEYRAALMGQLNLLGNWFTWDHIQSDYIDIPTKNEEVAQLWRDTVFNASYEVCMTFCEQLIACLNTDEDVQAALQAIINTQISQSVPVPATYPPGVANPQPNVNLAAGTNPTCNPDILWAQCLAIAMQTNNAIVDVLEKIEVSANSVELLDATTEVPLVGWAKEAVGGQAALDLVNYYQEAVNEEYNAQYTTTPGGVQDQIACALFCECKDDCEVTIDRVYSVLEQRLGEHVTVPSLDDLVNLIEFAAGVSQDNTMVVDLAFFFAWGAIKLGSFFFGRTFDITLTMLLQLSVNDANDDWELLCEDCPPPIDPQCYDLTSAAYGWVDTGQTKWYTGQGLGPTHAGGVEQFLINRPQQAPNLQVVEVRFKFNMPWNNVKVTMGVNGNAVVNTGIGNTIIMNEASHPTLFPYFSNGSGAIQVASNAASFIVPNGALRMTQYCLYVIAP